MASVAATPAPILKFESWLTAAGKDIERVFSDIFTPSNTTALDQLLTSLYPKFGTIINLVGSAVITVEQKFAAMGKQAGTGVQKLAAVLSIVGSALQTILGGNTTMGTIENIVNAVVAFLNSIQVPVAA